jgi:hypothetical protein
MGLSGLPQFGFPRLRGRTNGFAMATHDTLPGLTLIALCGAPALAEKNCALPTTMTARVNREYSATVNLHAHVSPASASGALFSSMDFLNRTVA